MAQSANEGEVIPVAEAETRHSDEESAKGDDKHVKALVNEDKFVSVTNVAREGKQGNSCVGNNVSSFAWALKLRPNGVPSHNKFSTTCVHLR